ncbi:MAG: thioredoxin family protein [Polyangiaceae bacterium]
MARTLVLLCLASVAYLACAARPLPSQPIAQRTRLASTSAAQLPLVVEVRADWCPTCRRIAPTIAALEREYAGRVAFLVLDVTDDQASARSAAAADGAGVGAFFRDNRATGVVAVFSPQRREVARLAGETDLSRYREPLSEAFATVSANQGRGP